MERAANAEDLNAAARQMAEAGTHFDRPTAAW
jgi:hypothetical protein